MKEWLENLAPRERMMVIGGAIALAVLLFYAMVWDPLSSGVNELRAEVESQRETLRVMRRSADEVKALRAASGGKGTRGLGGRSLLAVVDQSARSTGLGPALKRVEPEGQDDVRVRLEGASFDAMIGWLAGLAKDSQIFATSLSIERTDASGRVNVRLTLHTESG